MFEPEELMARIVDLEEQLKVSEMAPPAAEQLIACLEGEIAKRDARIVELQRYEHAFNEWHDKTEWVQAESATLSAKYLGCHRADVMRSLIDDLRAELAACRIAVENCDLFRARIAELEEENENLAAAVRVSQQTAVAVSKELRAELAAIKAQEPVAYIPVDRETGEEWHPVLKKGGGNICDYKPLYAAPVSEAKAQGVVMPTVDQAMRVVLREMGSSKHIRGTSNWCADVGRAVLDEVARLNAAPAQQVSVPDVSAMARILADRNADACNVNREDNWMIYGQDYIYDVTAMLAAAPAAPAADAGLVDMYRHLQTVTPYRFKKIQDASVTDGGDVLYFHKDRFDAALLDDMAANCAKESK